MVTQEVNVLHGIKPAENAVIKVIGLSAVQTTKGIKS
jgi:hypothetical protein